MSDLPLNPVFARLPDRSVLSDAELDLADSLLDGPVLTMAPRRDLLRDGERPRTAHLMLGGWACRYKTLEDGRRQITAFVLPGDLCDLHGVLLREMDHSLATITMVRYAEVTHDQVEALMTAPVIGKALWRDMLVTMAIQREWTASVGQRDALERLSHMLCELFFRLRAAGLVTDDRCEFPLTQTDLAEATGMTPVHVNRMVQEMRARGLIHWKGRVLQVIDLPGLCRAGLFNPAYLHLADDPRVH